MEIHPDIAALRADKALQCSVGSAMDAAHARWLEREDVSELAAALLAYAGGADLTEAAPLARLLSDVERACTFVGELTAHFIKTLRDQPLGEVPLRHASSEGFARLQLLQRGGAVLSLCVYEPTNKTGHAREPQAAQFADCEAHELVLAGGANGYLRRLEFGANGAAEVISRPTHWNAGVAIVSAPRREARQIVAVEQSLLVLQLTRTPSSPLPTVEYSLEDAALIRQSSGDRRASEKFMALGVLGALGDRRALTPMCDFALTKGEDKDARWEALRQVLAMDTGEGMTLLAALAGRTGDALAKPARDLRETLFQSQPALRAPAKEGS